jgi:glycosyltransferase involved in cell wall biosynthesis
VPHVCYVVHQVPPAEHTGTPLLALGYARAFLARGWTVTVVAGADPTEATWAEPQVAVDVDHGFVRVGVPVLSRWPVDGATTPDHGAAAGFQRLLDRLRPDVVHVVDNVHLALEIPEVAHDSGIPVVRTVSCAEDLCALIAPVSPCSGASGACVPPLTPEHCASCVVAAQPEWLATDPRDADDGEAGDPAWWRLRLLDALRRKRARAVHQFTEVFDRIVFSNDAWRAWFEATLPLDPAKARTVPMGIDTERWAGRARVARIPDPSEPVVFGFAGTLDPVKGADALQRAFESPELRERDDYRLRCFGGGDPALLGALAEHPRVELHGAYRSEELPDLLAGVHVGLAPSYFETWHRVTREYLLSGLPVISSNTLGVRDVLHHGVNGLLFDHAEPDSLVRALTAVLDDRALIARLADGAAATPIRTVDEEAEDRAALYVCDVRI